MAYGSCSSSSSSMSQVAGHAGALGEVLHQPFDGRRQAEVVQHQRAQVGGDAAGGGHAGVEHGQHLRQARGGAGRVGLEVVAHPDRVHLQGGERLRQFVVQLARDAGLFLLAHAAGLGGEGGQVLAGTQPLGDVAQDDRVQLALGGLQLRDRRLHRELLAALAQPHDHGAVAHAARGHAGLAEALHRLRVAGAKARRHQQAQRAAADFVDAPAEDPFGGAVVQDDVLLRVHGQDRVHGRVEQARQAGGHDVVALQGDRGRHRG